MFFENEKKAKEDRDWQWNLNMILIFWEIKSINLDDATTLKDASKFCSDSDRSIMGRIIMEEYEKEKERIKKIIPHLSIDDVKRN